MRSLGLLIGLVAGPALAGNVVTSAAPEHVAVTIYRAPDRGDQPMDRDWLRGYALITEERTVEIPAGRATLRFEGVAGGMLPESALVSGLPAGVREKNLDAALLSPRSLYVGAFGRPAVLRRRDEKTGAVREEPAVIRSTADGLIVETKAGFEAANCGPSTDGISFDRVPEALVAKPTLSVETEAAVASTAKVTLSYLAWGFDWQADYVVQMGKDGRTADILAWVTLASSDPTGFENADAAVVGGKVSREDEAPWGSPYQTEEMTFKCFAHPVEAVMPPPPPPVPMAAPMMMEAADIVLTARKMASPAVMAKEEALGDLKLYRLPVPTTVAANGQKQVAMLLKPGVKVMPWYVAGLYGGDHAVSRQLRMRNRVADGLGVSLPSGQVSVFEEHRGRPILAGSGSLADAAVAQDVDVGIGVATQVTVDEVDLARGKGWAERKAVVRNANPWPVRFEGVLRPPGDQRIGRSSAKLGKRNGQTVWQVTVPANSTRQLDYRVDNITR